MGEADPSRFPMDGLVNALRSLYTEGVSGKGAGRAKDLIQVSDTMYALYKYYVFSIYTLYIVILASFPSS